MKKILSIAIALALVGFLQASYAQGSKNCVINHFVSDPNVIESHLVITDVIGEGPMVNLKFFNNEGRQIGDGKELIPKFGKLNLDPGKYVRNAVVNGTIQIESTGGNIISEYWQFYKKNSESWKNTTAVGMPQPGYNNWVCPHVVCDQNVEAYIVVANSDGKDATVEVTLYDDGGRQLGSTREMVKANGKLILKPMEISKSKATGVAHITSTGGKVTGEYWQAEKSKEYQVVVPMGGM